MAHYGDALAGATAGPGLYNLSSPNLEKALTFLDDKLLRDQQCWWNEVTAAM